MLDHKTRNLWKKSKMYRKFAVKIVFNRPKQGNDTFDNNDCLKFKLCTPRRQHEITCSTSHYKCTMLQTVHCKQWKTLDKIVINWIKVELRWTKFEVSEKMPSKLLKRFHQKLIARTIRTSRTDTELVWL